jgi:hypothetical protein
MKRLAALLVTGSLLLTACSTDAPSDDPKGALMAAMQNTGQLEGLTTRMSLRSTVESLQAMAEDGGSLDAEDAEKILDSSFTISARGQGPEGEFEMVVNVAGEDSIELKVVDRVFYARADVVSLVETFGGNPDSVEDFAGTAEAQGAGFLRPAIEGEWVSIEGLDQTLQQMSGQAAAPSLPQQQELIENMTRSFQEHATVTSEGGEEPGEHMVVTVPLRPIYADLVDDFKELTAQLPATTFPDSSQVPNEDITLDVWVADERVTQVEFDFLQLNDLMEGGEDIPAGVEEFAFRMELEEFTDEVRAPEDAVAIDPQQILGLLGGFMMGGMGMGSGAVSPPAGDMGAAFNCNDLKGAPPEVLRQFAEECPELQP